MPVPSTASEWKNCGAEDAKMTVNNVLLTPDSITRGATLKFVITGNTEVAVPGGTLKVAVAYHGWHVFSKTGSLCNSTACPMPKGPFTLNLESHLPSVTPPGPYTITITATSSDDKTVGLCVAVPFHVAMSSAQ
ncbi:hypothetical protein WJX72_001325 [[Myrmecia] bisecta]|uniref:MD-2-related lipid-recognition domain-containing protein n=1 Tax=[Myrmecia] bisecta TaxID=41462 RepID=A0AAW1PFC8_9CHLO